MNSADKATVNQGLDQAPKSSDILNVISGWVAGSGVAFTSNVTITNDAAAQLATLGYTVQQADNFFLANIGVNNNPGVIFNAALQDGVTTSQCDMCAPEPADMTVWNNVKPVGREVW